MDALFSNPAYLWLGGGALLVIVEAMIGPGLGIFLGGLGAICAGILIVAGVVAPDAVAIQFICFFGFTIIWTVVLWGPLMKFRAGKGGKDTSSYNDIVGGTATVSGQALERGATGQVSWSGTIMNAELDASATVDSLPAGTQVIIKSVSGNTFKVTPK